MKKKADNINKFNEILNITRHNYKYRRDIRKRHIKVKDKIINGSLEVEYFDESDYKSD